MTTCDICQRETDSAGLDGVIVAGYPDTEISAFHHHGGHDDLESVDDRDLCDSCAAKWIIEKLRPIVEN